MHTIETTHVGSLPRPKEMHTKLLRKREVTREALKGYLKGIVERQMSLGITYINNGELPRMDYVQSTVDRITGFGQTGTAPIPRDLEELPELSRRFSGRNGLITLNPKAPVKLPACSEPLSYTGAASLRGELDMMVDVYSEAKPLHPRCQSEVVFYLPVPGHGGAFHAKQLLPKL